MHDSESEWYGLGTPQGPKFIMKPDFILATIVTIPKKDIAGFFLF